MKYLLNRRHSLPLTLLTLIFAITLLPSLCVFLIPRRWVSAFILLAVLFSGSSAKKAVFQRPQLTAVIQSPV